MHTAELCHKSTKTERKAPMGKKVGWGRVGGREHRAPLASLKSLMSD